ncbi:hypothetical protein ACH4VR_29275 [Streptomyces sp. NPDC020883]|uniref:hypothetical protein n=1 Tax=Streptomyces sp. NPDC020883 TaxID=3365099 RepID=UPI0037A3C000
MKKDQIRGGTRTLISSDHDPASSTTPSPWRRAKIAGISFAAVLIAGIVLTNFTGEGGTPDTGSAQATDSPAAAPSPGGSGGKAKADQYAGGVPVGYPHSKEGAIAAAVNYEMARSSPSYFTDQNFRHSVLTTVMAESSMQAQQKTDDRDAAKLVASLGIDRDNASSMVMRAAPLGTRVSNYSPQGATVDVWMSELIGMTNADSPLPVSASWTTYKLRVEWSGSDWKLMDISRSDGPTPLQTSDAAPDSVATFQKMDKDFHAPPYTG